jgi:DNA-directed RNA polymerase
MIWDTLTDDAQLLRNNAQIGLEQEMLEYGRTKYWNDYNRAPDEGIPEQCLIDSSVKTLRETYQEWIDTVAQSTKSPAWIYPLLELGAAKMADITIRALVRCWFTSSFWGHQWNNEEHAPPLAQTISTQIAQDACDIISFQRAREEFKDDWKKQSKFIKNWTTKRCRAFAIKMERNVKLRVKNKHAFGHHMLLIAAASNIIVMNTRRIKLRGGKFRNYVFVEFHSDVLKELHNRHDILQSSILVYRPMIVPPQPHTLISSGGYITHTLRKPVVQRYKSNHFGESPKEQKFSEPSPLVLRGLEAMMNTEWAVNTQVLEVMKTLFENNSGLANLPTYEFREFMDSSAYPKDGSKEEQSIWCQIREEQWSEWYKQEQARGRMLVRLKLAETMAEWDFFFHVYTLDFRGRAYTTCELLSPQSSDFDRGLSIFAKGCKLTDEGRYWQRVHLANLFDQDKLSLDDRVKWVEDNWDSIERTADDPYSMLSWWVDDAKKKNKSFQRLAIIFDITRKDGLSFIPIQIDGKCNGNQHWSAIMGDEGIAKLVGVFPSEEPQDLYQHVADHTTDYCKLHRDNNPWYGDFLDKWTVIDRKVTKRPTMCEAYGLTFYGIQKYLRYEGHLDWIPKDKSAGATVELARAIKAALDKILKSSNRGKLWLRSIIEVANDLNQHLEWTTPSGFKVLHYYNKVQTRRSLAKMFNNKQLTFFVRTDDINPRTALQAISPNFIHSLDAAHMFLCIDKMRALGIKNYSMIHDSFGCPANEVGIMRNVIRQEFYKMHKTNRLHALKTEVEHKLGVILPNPPDRGTLDLTRVLESEYFFA